MCMCMRTHVYVHTCLRVHVHVRVRARARARARVCRDVNVCVPVYICTRSWVRFSPPRCAITAWINSEGQMPLSPLVGSLVNINRSNKPSAKRWTSKPVRMREQ